MTVFASKNFTVAVCIYYQEEYTRINEFREDFCKVVVGSWIKFFGNFRFVSVENVTSRNSHSSPI